MSDIFKKQIKMIEFIRESVSNAEGEEYFVRRLNLYHPNYTIFGDNFYIGSVLIICNEAYKNGMDGYGPNRFLYGPWAEGSVIDYEKQLDGPISKAQARPYMVYKGDDERKAILIKYSNFWGRNHYTFKNVLNTKKVKEQFPYILETLGCLKGNTIYDQDVDQLIQYLSTRMEVPTEQNVKTRKMG